MFVHGNNLFQNFFYKQEPASESEILTCLRYIRPGNDFEPNFTLTRKYDVNGLNEHPLFTYLKVRWLPWIGPLVLHNRQFKHQTLTPT